MKDIIRLVVVLVAICTVAGLALAGVYDFTKKHIELQLLQYVIACKLLWRTQIVMCHRNIYRIIGINRQRNSNNLRINNI